MAVDTKDGRTPEQRLRLIEDRFEIYNLIASHPPSADTGAGDYTASVCFGTESGPRKDAGHHTDMTQKTGTNEGSRSASIGTPPSRPIRIRYQHVVVFPGGVLVRC